jgi:hypothetical protein
VHQLRRVDEVAAAVGTLVYFLAAAFVVGVGVGVGQAVFGG